MRTIYAEYNINHDSIDVYTSAGYMLRIDCWKAEKNLKTTYGSECALTSLAVDEPLEYARLYLEGNLMETKTKKCVRNPNEWQEVRHSHIIAEVCESRWRKGLCTL